jgi:8-oxo-dGTP diphosphatase
MATPKARAACVCFDGENVLVMRRHKGDRDYSVLPGGGVEPGEEPAAAAVRELEEETGLRGCVIRHLISIDHPDRTAHYYLLRAVVGPMTLGGPEAAIQSTDNRYSPEWIPISSVEDEPIVPMDVRAIIRDAYAARW